MLKAHIDRGQTVASKDRYSGLLVGEPPDSPAPVNAYAMIRRRATAVEITPMLGNHIFRATGNTAYPKNWGTLYTARGQSTNGGKPVLLYSGLYRRQIIYNLFYLNY